MDGDGDAQGLPIGRVAEATGMSVHALRFFEREGLFLREIPRSAGGRRFYTQADVEWLRLCDRLRASGMPIAVIGRFAAPVRAGPGNEPDRLALLREHERAVRARIEELGACLEVISGKAAAYARHVRDGTAAGLWEPETPGTPETRAERGTLGRAAAGSDAAAAAAEPEAPGVPEARPGPERGA